VQLPQLSLLSSPELQLNVNDKGVDVSGRVIIPEATARIRDLPTEAVKRSSDVVIHTEEQSLEDEADEKVVTGNIEVVLGDNVKFYGFGLESRLDGSLRVTQRPGRSLRGNGTVRVRDGFLTGYGKELRVDRGTLTFTGPLDDPAVDVQVSREAVYENRRYTVGLRLSGAASNLKTEPFSRPAMSEQDILAFLLLDRPASGSGEDTGVSGALLAMGLGQMMPGDSGKFGLDEISFEGSELNQTAVVAGKRISDDIYIRYVFGLFGQPGQFRIRYRLGRGFSLEATTGGTSQALDLIYLIERE
jgi:translocation and assembly module TamB